MNPEESANLLLLAIFIGIAGTGVVAYFSGSRWVPALLGAGTIGIMALIIAWIIAG